METGKKSGVKLYLAGSLYLTIDDVPITSFHSLKTQALLAYLALEGEVALQRDDLAAMFWDGYTRKSGRANLRMSLSNLRQLLGTRRDLLGATRNTVQMKLEEDSNLWCDVLHVQQVIQNGSQAAREQLQERLKAFDRVLLPGFEEIDSPVFLEWLHRKRAQYMAMISQLRQPKVSAHTRLTARHNLPRALKKLFGRNHDISSLTSLLDSPHHPLITLVGPGGVGKTELALATARQHLKNSSDEVWFVQLDKIQPSESAEIVQKQVLQQIAHALRFVPRDQGSLLEQIKQYVETRQMLLILDNCEHVLSAAPLIFDLLRDSHELKILATSRKRLNDFSETIYRVNGLATDGTSKAPSVQLFQERLMRMGSPIRPKDTRQQEAIIGICQLLNGLPLGIELATTLCESRKPTDLHTLLQSDLTSLATDMQAVPERHRSLWTVMAYSWQQLTWEEQRTLLQCTVILGSFSAETAVTITQSAHATLNSLIQYGFITPTQNNQYTLHPQIRTFCLERSQNNPALFGWLTQSEHRHATTYLEWLIQQAQALRQDPQKIKVIQHQLADIEQAWQWCVARNLTHLISKASQPLANCLQSAGLSQSGIVWFEQALNTQNDPRVCAYLRTALATLYLAKDNHGAVIQQIRLLKTDATLLSPYLQAQIQLLEGHLSRQTGDYAVASAAYKAVSRYQSERSADFTYLAISASYHLGQIYAADNAWEAAETVWEKGARLAVTNKDRLYQALFCQALGQAAYAQTDYKRSWEKLTRGLKLAGSNVPVPDLHYHTALAAYELRRYSDAHYHLSEALPVYHQYQMSDQKIKSLLMLSQTEWLLQMNDAAHQSAIEALDLAQLSGDTALIDRAIELLDWRVTPTANVRA